MKETIQGRPECRNVFILGTKGIPANYGGFETFVEKLTLNRQDKRIQYYVYCQRTREEYRKGPEAYRHNGAVCFPVPVPEIGPAKAVWYDWRSLKLAMRYIERKQVENAVIFLCACRIGSFLLLNRRKIRALGARLVINPDGHEWLRAKWNRLIKWYWRFSERLSVKCADFLVCDSAHIEKYIQEDYKKYSPKTTFIAYGSETIPSKLADDDEKIRAWYEKWGLEPKGYYINIGRLVPENNYETMVREFMASKTERKLVLAATIGKNKFYEKLKKELGFEQDPRILFVDGIYDEELLKKIRENAYGYIHGHSVGGTNPSLLEALGTLDLNLLYDVGFNREVGEEGARYWTLEKGSLSSLINEVDHMPYDEIKRLGETAHRRIGEHYTWEGIARRYEEVFLDGAVNEG